MKKLNISQKNESLKKQSEEAEKLKGKTIDPTDKKFHQPNRPSV